MITRAKTKNYAETQNEAWKKANPQKVKDEAEYHAKVNTTLIPKPVIEEVKEEVKDDNYLYEGERGINEKD